MFIYNSNIINELERSISSERLSKYLIVANGHKEKALKLYLWNAEISTAFYLPLQGLEVTLRNAMHSALSIKFESAHWYDLAPLNDPAKEIIRKAKYEVMKAQGVVNAPHVVAELSFGFWLSLLNREYHQTLWIPVLGKSFRNAELSRGKIRSTLDHLRVFRNRIFHHEPIFTRCLDKDYESTIKVIGWINTTKAKWIFQHNNVMETIGKKPII